MSRRRSGVTWRRSVNAEWVVYAKRPFAGPAQVLDYVGRYTHRVAISNNRLVSMDDGKVRFRWKDYRDGNRQKTMTLEGGGVHPPLPDPCAAGRVSPHPLLRLPRQLPSRAQSWRAAGNCSGWRRPNHRLIRRRLPRSVRGTDRPLLARMSHCHTGIMVVIACIARFAGLPAGSGYIMNHDQGPTARRRKSARSRSGKLAPRRRSKRLTGHRALKCPASVGDGRFATAASNGASTQLRIPAISEARRERQRGHQRP